MDVHEIFANRFKGVEPLAYALSINLAEGQICVDISSYQEEFSASIYENNQLVVSQQNFESLCLESPYVGINADDLKPFIIKEGKAYLHRYYRYETLIIEHIKRLNSNFTIITGGPGTGKTYSVANLLVEQFTKNPTLKVALAAPTAKAAVRMSESIKNYAENPSNHLSDRISNLLTNLKAQTLHRLLGYKRNSVFFKHDEIIRLPFDIVIIDECSMIDGAMMAKLMNAINTTTQLYLLGDKDQLSAVEAGSVFSDLCQAKDAAILHDKIVLKTITWRFDENMGIGRFSKEIIEGDNSGIDRYENDEQVTIDKNYSEELFKAYALEYQSYLKEIDIKTALKKLNNVRFLCATRRNKHSVEETNQRIEKLLKSELKDPSLFNPKEGTYHNQPILITKNNYNLGVFNGDIALIRWNGNALIAYIENNDGSIKSMPAGYLTDFETAFAMTIHKSQGSEFNKVVVVLPETPQSKLLTRELLYTAVTRAKTKLLVQSSEETLKTCIERRVERSSGLTQRLNKITL